MATKSSIQFSMVSVVLLLAGLTPVMSAEVFDWGHFGQDWHDGECDGSSQSPINIVTSEAKKEKTNKFYLQYELSTEVAIVNTGHGIYGNVKNTSNNILHTAEGEFRLTQFHFHVFSEHAINGMFGPMEFHFVHMNAATGHISVVGIIAQIHKEDKDNAFLGKFFPLVENDTISSHVVQLDLAEFLKPHRSSMKALNHYTYPGSLTVPPCSEIVTWYVLKKTVKISIQQMLKISEADASVHEANRINNRAPEPLGDRPLTFREVY